MRALKIKRRFLQQPQHAVQVDRSSELGARLIEHYALRGDRISSLYGVPVTYGAGGKTAPSATGLGLKGSGSSARASTPINLSRWSKLTFSFTLNWPEYANDDALAMEFGANYAIDNGILIDPNNSGGGFLVGIGTSDGSNLLIFPRPSANTPHRITLSFDRNTGTAPSTQAWVDGVRQAMSLDSRLPLQSMGANVTFGNNTLYLLSRANSSLFGSGTLQDLSIYEGVFNDGLAAQDAENNWGAFVQPSFVLRAPEVVANTALSGGAVASIFASGMLSTQVRLAGAASTVSTASGALSTQVRLAGGVALQASAAGALTTQVRLAGAASLNVSASGALAGGGAVLTGTAALGASASGALSTLIPLAGAAVLQVVALGQLDGGSAQLAGAAVARMAASGALSTSIPLSGTAAIVSAASGSLAGAGAALSGAAAIASSAAGSLSTAILLTGAAALQVGSAGTLAGSAVVLSGGASMRATGTGDLSTAIVLSGLAPARIAASGSITTWIALSGAARVTASAAGALGLGVRYARAPAGYGYTPQRHEYQSRPAQVGGARPPATEKAYR